jgi:hypothetical protein
VTKRSIAIPRRGVGFQGGRQTAEALRFVEEAGYALTDELTDVLEAVRQQLEACGSAD